MAQPGRCPRPLGGRDPAHSGQAPLDWTGVSPPHWCFSKRRRSSWVSVSRLRASSSFTLAASRRGRQRRPVRRGAATWRWRVGRVMPHATAAANTRRPTHQDQAGQDDGHHGPWCHTNEGVVAWLDRSDHSILTPMGVGPKLVRCHRHRPHEHLCRRQRRLHRRPATSSSGMV
jgi:hypothetical protein